MGILVSPAFFIAGVAVGSSANVPVGKAWEYISITLSAVATFVISVLTIILAVETWRLRRNQDKQIQNNYKESIRPHIEIFLSSSLINFQFMLFNVENIGKGIARNIRFEIENPEQNFSESEKEIIYKLDALSFFKNSLNALGVHQSKQSFLFSFIDMYDKYNKDFYETVLTFKIIYSDMDGNIYTNYSVIDLSEYKGITSIGKGNPVYRTAGELEKIRKLLNTIINGNKKMKIESYSLEDRKLQEKLLEERMDEYLSNQQE